MKKLAMNVGTWAALPLLALTMAGCGLIPDAEVSNPLQFDGESVAVAFPGAGASAITLQAITGSGSLEAPIGFSDDDLGSGAISPASLSIDGGFSGDAVLVANVYPDQIALSDLALTVRLWQGAESFDGASADNRVEPDPFTGGSDLTLNKVDAGCAASCAYAFAFPSVAASSLAIEIDGSDLTRTLEILSESPNANFVDVTLEVTATSTPDIGAGSSLTFTLEAADGTLTF